MSFTSTYQLINGVAQLMLTGDLDAAAATALRANIEKAVADKARTMVWFMKDLEFMSSAGVRLLVVARQQMGTHKIYLIGVQEEMKEFLTMLNFQNMVTFLDAYDATQIE